MGVREGLASGYNAVTRTVCSGGFYVVGFYLGGKILHIAICKTYDCSFFFSRTKIVFRHTLRRVRFEICSKLTIKTPEDLKLTIKLTIKIPLTSYSPLYC